MKMILHQVSCPFVHPDLPRCRRMFHKGFRFVSEKLNLGTGSARLQILHCRSNESWGKRRDQMPKVRDRDLSRWWNRRCLLDFGSCYEQGKPWEDSFTVQQMRNPNPSNRTSSFESVRDRPLDNWFAVYRPQWTPDAPSLGLTLNGPVYYV